jgi:hypothetical protein
MVDGISDIMEDMEVSIIFQQLYKAYVHTILIGNKVKMQSVITLKNQICEKKLS